MSELFRVTFSPGAAVAVIGSFVALVDGPDCEIVNALVAEIGTADRSGLFASIRSVATQADFVVAFAQPDGLHVLYAGNVLVDVLTADGPPTRLPTSASGCAEHVVADATTCSMRTANAAPVSSGRYWTTRGVVAAQAVGFTIEPQDQALGDSDDEGHTVMRPGRQAGVRPVTVDTLPAVGPTVEPTVGPAAGSDPMMISSVPVAGTQVPLSQPGFGSNYAALMAGSVPDPSDHTIARPSRLRSGSLRRTPPPHVLAVRCAAGHAGPPNSSTCRTCGRPISDHRPVDVARPVLGILRFSDGHEIALDGPAVIGRLPPPQVTVDGEAATTLAIDSAELSRVHAVVHVVDWSVQVSDQQSTNGTTVHLPGYPPQKLRPYEKVTISLGARIELGNAVQFTFELSPE